MLESLIESRHSTAYRSAFGGGAISLVVHSALITGAVYATLRASEPARLERPIVPVQLPPEPKEASPRPRRALPDLPAVPWTSMRLPIPAAIPTEIPPPSAAPFDPSLYAGIGPDSGGILGRDERMSRIVSPTAVYSANVVEERPERIGGPEPRYPEILRQAGIDGRVLVECVVDTLGRAEPGSVRVLSASNVLFEQPAREAIAASLFRPARLGGRAVRVRVQLPVIFRVARGSLANP